MRNRALAILGVATLLALAILLRGDLGSLGGGSFEGAESESAPRTRGEEPGVVPLASAPARRRRAREDPANGPAPADPGGLVLGRVTNLGGKPIENAWVSVAYGRREADESGLASWRFEAWPSGPRSTDVDGNFRLELPRGGYFCVEAGADGWKTASAHRHPRRGRFEERIDFRLVREDRMTMRGLLLDLRGAPLSPEDIRFLFADDFPASDDSREIGVSGIWALAGPYRRPGQVERGKRAVIDADRATFEIQTLSGWEPLLVALSRDRLLGKQFWRKGEPEVEFRVDVAGIRASLGALEIRAVDAANGASLGATVRIEGHALAAGGYQYPSLRIDPDEGLRLVNVPPGGYTAIASAAGYEALARAEVAPGRTTRTTVRFAQPAHVVLRFLPEEGWLPPRASRVEYRDTEGRALSCTWREEPGTNGTLIRVGGAPPGPGVLLCAGNALEVQLEPGSNGERDFPVRPPRLLRVKWKETAEERFAHDGEGRLLYEGRTRVAEKSWPADFTFDPEWDHVDFSAAPGRYAVEVELASGRRARGEVIVGVGEITEVVIEPR